MYHMDASSVYALQVSMIVCSTDACWHSDGHLVAVPWNLLPVLGAIAVARSMELEGAFPAQLPLLYLLATS